MSERTIREFRRLDAFLPEQVLALCSRGDGYACFYAAFGLVGTVSSGTAKSEDVLPSLAELIRRGCELNSIPEACGLVLDVALETKNQTYTAQQLMTFAHAACSIRPRYCNASEQDFLDASTHGNIDGLFP